MGQLEGAAASEGSAGSGGATLLHMDPLAIFGKLYAEEKLQMHAYEVPSGAYKGRLAIQVRLKDKKPWYRRML